MRDLNKQKIRLKIIGKKNFSSKLNNLLKKSEKITLKNKRLQINLALNYGSKAELIYAFNCTPTDNILVSDFNKSIKIAPF